MIDWVDLPTSRGADRERVTSAPPLYSEAQTECMLCDVTAVRLGRFANDERAFLRT